MIANIELLVTYNNTFGNTSVAYIPITCANFTVDHAESYCNVSHREGFRNTRMVASVDDDITFTVDVIADLKNNKWNISNITVGLNLSSAADDFPNSIGLLNDTIEGYVNENVFSDYVDINSYYLCSSNLSFPLQMVGKVGSNFKMVLTMAKLRVQAVEFEDNLLFFGDKNLVCAQDNQPDQAFIPIVIGSIMGGLILVVLVAYIVGRFRKTKLKQETYETL
jgi:hypothetical protein